MTKVSLFSSVSVLPGPLLTPHRYRSPVPDLRPSPHCPAGSCPSGQRLGAGPFLPAPTGPAQLVVGKGGGQTRSSGSQMCGYRRPVPPAPRPGAESPVCIGLGSGPNPGLGVSWRAVWWGQGDDSDLCALLCLVVVAHAISFSPPGLHHGRSVLLPCYRGGPGVSERLSMCPESPRGGIGT